MYYTHIVLHHSLTKDSGTVSWDAIRRHHTQELGWRDIGYNFGIERVEDSYQCFVGRPLGIPGAHCKQEHMNRRGIGICCVGNYDWATPHEVMLKDLVRRLIIPLMEIFEISEDRIMFHREFEARKSCPGRRFRKEHVLSYLQTTD